MDTDTENYLPLDLHKLDLEESLDELLQGNWVLIKGIEQTRGKDILVRLDGLDKGAPVTQITYDVQPPDGYWKEHYWTVFDLPLNAFSTYPCYIHHTETNGSMPAFLPGETIYYTSRQEGTSGKRDSGIIEEVYIKNSEDNQFYYSISRDTGIYQEEELAKDPLK